MTTQGFQLTREFLDGELAVLTSLVDSVKAKQGSASLRHKEATQTALGVNVKFTESDDVSAIAGVVALYRKINDGFSLGDLAAAVHALDEWANQIANEAVTEILKAQGDDTSLDALRTQYAAQKAKVEALVVVCGLDPSIDVSDVVIPALRSGRSASPTTQRKGKHGHFYRILPTGDRREVSAAQDTLSSVAWYYGAAIVGVEEGSTNSGKGVPVTELESFLRKHVTDSPLGKPWTIERQVKDQTVKFGYEIVDGDASEEE